MKCFDKIVNNKKLILFILFTVSIVIKIIIYNTFIDSYKDGFPDKYEYQSMGEQIATGNWNPVYSNKPMRVAPVIPTIIALSKVIFGDGVLPTIIFNIIISSLTIFVLYFLGKKLFNRTIGILMALWSSLSYDAAKYSMFTLKESLLFFILPLTILLLLKTLNKRFDFINIFLSVFTFIILIHTDERFVIYLFLFPLIIFYNKNINGFFNKTKQYLLWLFIALIMMLPWTIRNFYVFDQLVIISPRTTAFTADFWGDNLTGGLNFTNELTDDNVRDYQKRTAEKFQREYGMTPRLFTKSEARIKAFINYWQPVYFTPEFIQHGYRVEYWSLRTNIASILFYGMFLPFYVIGIIYLIKKKYFLALFVALIPVLHSILHAYMIWPLFRYRSTMDFIVALTGMWIILEIICYIKLKLQKNYIRS